MLLVDLEEGRIVPDEEIKSGCRAAALREWLKENQITLGACPRRREWHARISRPCSAGSAPSATPTRT
jgi:hypothetical protein